MVIFIRFYNEGIHIILFSFMYRNLNRTPLSEFRDPNVVLFFCPDGQTHLAKKEYNVCISVCLCVSVCAFDLRK